MHSGQARPDAGHSTPTWVPLRQPPREGPRASSGREGSRLGGAWRPQRLSLANVFLGAKRDLGRRYVTRGRTVARNPRQDRSSRRPFPGTRPCCPSAPLPSPTPALSHAQRYLAHARAPVMPVKALTPSASSIIASVMDGRKGRFLSRFSLSAPARASGRKWLQAVPRVPSCGTLGLCHRLTSFGQRLWFALTASRSRS